ncbi:MAG TPA: hypothetical protein ENI61_00225 [Ignavibacteria bacterium]|nr:hypothetical protein [Ignavibacteria bacterium]
MEEIKKETQQPTPTKNKWFAGYIVAGLIWTFSQSFKKNSIDELIILAVAILAGIFYHRLKSKIRIKDNASRSIATFIILSIVSGFLIGASATVVDKFYTKPIDNNAIISGSIRENFVSGLKGSCIRNQMNDPRSASLVSAKVISNYCSCYANGIADQITFNDINLYDTAPASELKKMFQPKIDSISPTCQKILQDK